MAFPNNPCDVCHQPIIDIETSSIRGDHYSSYLKLLLNEYGSSEQTLKSEQASFVKTITLEYFKQFPERFKKKHPQITTMSEYLKDELIDANAHKYRLEQVIQKTPTPKNLYLLLHNNCIPENFDSPSQYVIELSRTNTAEKAIEWTIHLSKKISFNPEGWIQTLEKLFERRRV